MAYEQNIEITKGEDIVLQFAPPSVRNITGYTLQLYIGDDPGPAGVGDPSLTVAGTIGDAEAGTFSVTLSSAQTTTLGAGLFRYSVWTTTPGSQKELARGGFTVRETPRW